MNDLATQFHINRTTVLNHVRRAGVLKRRRQAFSPGDLQEAIRLYAAGHSAESIAESLHVAPTTVRRTLKAAGVTMRARGRRKRPG